MRAADPRRVGMPRGFACARKALRPQRHHRAHAGGPHAVRELAEFGVVHKVPPGSLHERARPIVPARAGPPCHGRLGAIRLRGVLLRRGALGRVPDQLVGGGRLRQFRCPQRVAWPAAGALGERPPPLRPGARAPVPALRGRGPGLPPAPVRGGGLLQNVEERHQCSRLLFLGVRGQSQLPPVRCVNARSEMVRHRRAKLDRRALDRAVLPDVKRLSAGLVRAPRSGGLQLQCVPVLRVRGGGGSRRVD
mmetsp:Transcript_8055/g.23889  ORF Transcript_8055/g.23889 Transcript_8055/m.23889 type:complete len:249 (+) Transcript_8055:460-1206(+)